MYVRPERYEDGEAGRNLQVARYGRSYFMCGEAVALVTGCRVKPSGFV